MEQNFQTSFIPKKPIIEETSGPKKPMSFFMIFAILVFLTMALSFGGIYLYKASLNQKIEEKKLNLDRANKRFEVDTIVELQTLDKRLRSANAVLAKHLTISPVFEVLQDITMKKVRYTRFSYDIGENDKVIIQINGKATSYKEVALQSDLYSENKNIIEPIFSNLNLDDEGNVLFDLEFSVDPGLVNYKQALDRQSGPEVEPENIIPAGAGEEN